MKDWHAFMLAAAILGSGAGISKVLEDKWLLSLIAAVLVIFTVVAGVF